MKLGCISFFDGNSIVLPQEFAVALGLLEGSNLSICYWTERCDHFAVNSIELVSSSIPFHLWDDIYECTLTLRHASGTSANAARALDEMNCNILQSESMSVGLMNKGYWTVILEYKTNNSTPYDIVQFKEQIVNLNNEYKFLPNIFDVDQDILYRKLNLLDNCSKKILPNMKFEAKLNKGRIILPDDLTDLIARSSPYINPSRCVFIAIDTEERILTFSIVMTTRTLYYINVLVDFTFENPIKPDSNKRDEQCVTSSGIFAKIADLLSRKQFNILRSYNFNILKDRNNTHEIASVHFIADHIPLGADDLSSIETEITSLTHGSCKSLIKGRSVKDVSKCDLDENPLIIIPAEIHKPKCFISRISSLQNESLLNRVREVIEKNNFQPIEVDPFGNDVPSSVLKEIEKCCCMVLIAQESNFKQIRNGESINIVSPWLEIENAIAYSLKIPVFRFLDNNIRAFTFDRGADFKRVDMKNIDYIVQKIDKTLSEWTRTSEFFKCLSRASKRAMKYY